MTNADTPGAPASSEPFEHLVREHYSRVARFFARRFKPDESLDLTQETFVRVYRAMGRYAQIEQPGRWIFRITTNVWRNELRRRGAFKRRGRELPLEADGPSEPAWHPTDRALPVVETLIQQEQLSRVLHLIEALPARMRQALLLHVQGHSYEEVARIMGGSVETVRAQIYEARRRLRKTLRAGPTPADDDRVGTAPSGEVGHD